MSVSALTLEGRPDGAGLQHRCRTLGTACASPFLDGGRTCAESGKISEGRRRRRSWEGARGAPRMPRGLEK